MLLTSLKKEKKKNTHSSWFLNRAGNSVPCYSLVGVTTPANLTLWWEPKQNILYLEDKTQNASQDLNPFLNTLTAASFATSGVMVSSQLLKDCPCSIMPCPSCKADGNSVPLWQTCFFFVVFVLLCFFFFSFFFFWQTCFAAQLEPTYGVDFMWG